MGFLRKFEIAGGLTSLSFDAYAIYNPAFTMSLVNAIHDYLPLPEGASPVGVDYKTITRIVIIGASMIGGLVALLDREDSD